MVKYPNRKLSKMFDFYSLIEKEKLTQVYNL